MKENGLATSVSYGLCECGCGEKTAIARVTDRSKGWVGGKPFPGFDRPHDSLETADGGKGSRKNRLHPGSFRFGEVR